MILTPTIMAVFYAALNPDCMVKMRSPFVINPIIKCFFMLKNTARALFHGLKILMSRLPEEEGILAGKILEGDSFLFCEVAIVVVHLH